MKNSSISTIIVPEYIKLRTSTTHFTVSTYMAFSSKELFDRILSHVRKEFSELYRLSFQSYQYSDHDILLNDNALMVDIRIYQKYDGGPIRVKFSKAYRYSDDCFNKAFAEFRVIQNRLMIVNRRLKVIRLTDEIFDLKG